MLWVLVCCIQTAKLWDLRRSYNYIKSLPCYLVRTRILHTHIRRISPIQIIIWSKWNCFIFLPFQLIGEGVGMELNFSGSLRSIVFVSSRLIRPKITGNYLDAFYVVDAIMPPCAVLCCVVPYRVVPQQLDGWCMCSVIFIRIYR